MANRNDSVITDKGGVIQLTSSGLEQLVAERQGKIQAHLNENSKIEMMRGDMLTAVLVSAVKSKGLPSADEEAAFFERVASLAARASDRQLRMKWEAFKSTLAELNTHDAPAELVWAAKRCGVTLFDGPKK